MSWCAEHQCRDPSPIRRTDTRTRGTEPHKLAVNCLYRTRFPSSGSSEDLLTYIEEEQFLTQILNDVPSIMNMSTFRKRDPTFCVVTKDKRPEYKINQSHQIPGSHFPVSLSCHWNQESFSARWRLLVSMVCNIGMKWFTKMKKLTWIIDKTATDPSIKSCLFKNAMQLFAHYFDCLLKKENLCIVQHFTDLQVKDQNMSQAHYVTWIHISITETALVLIGKPSVRIFKEEFLSDLSLRWDCHF